MGIIFRKILKCENCGYEYHGKSGGHVISKGEHYDISQYYCNICHSMIDLECYSSLKENKERYIYPDGTEFSYDINDKDDEEHPENITLRLLNGPKNQPPFCQKCGDHLFKFVISGGEYAVCPKCGHKSLKQKEIHVTAYVD